MMLLGQFLPPLLVAALASSSLLFLSLKLTDESASLGRALCAAAEGTGFFAGYVMVAGMPGFPPASATHWIAFLIIPAVLHAAMTPRSLWRALSRILIAVLTCALLLRPKFQHDWSPAASAVWVAGLALAMAVCWFALERTVKGPPNIAAAIGVAGLLVATSVVLAVSGSLFLGHLGLIAMAVWSVAASFGLWRTSAAAIRGSIPLVAITFAALCLSGYFYAEAPAISLLLLAGSPISAAFGTVIRTRDPASWQSRLFRLALFLVPAGLAVAFALKAVPPAEVAY
jgi:hypothetical protein